MMISKTKDASVVLLDAMNNSWCCAENDLIIPSQTKTNHLHRTQKTSDYISWSLLHHPSSPYFLLMAGGRRQWPRQRNGQDVSLLCQREWACPQWSNHRSAVCFGTCSYLLWATKLSPQHQLWWYSRHSCQVQFHTLCREPVALLGKLTDTMHGQV